MAIKGSLVNGLQAICSEDGKRAEKESFCRSGSSIKTQRATTTTPPDSNNPLPRLTESDNLAPVILRLHHLAPVIIHLHHQSFPHITPLSASSHSHRPRHPSALSPIALVTPHHPAKPPLGTDISTGITSINLRNQPTGEPTSPSDLHPTTLSQTVPANNPPLIGTRWLSHN
ncbi:hypothetical protein PGTUg99_001733 [Puccinia graminis f. sp. tritici]|uniref:Uncharacterized protein n=1 Tax=Puccinia graminis f. sp. tritici TaxID=56615 RepID=A0A5B0NTY4_PUCGR|nr:hypothetical protein PGTUg99_001733 [Puccinia graminis f. sp. tritici]